MKLKLLRDVRPFGRTGETVEASPENSEFLLSLGAAVTVEEIREQIEAPEKAAEQAAKTEPAAAKKTKTAKKK